MKDDSNLNKSSSSSKLINSSNKKSTPIEGVAVVVT